jgi:hypothetical protein
MQPNALAAAAPSPDKPADSAGLPAPVSGDGKALPPMMVEGSGPEKAPDGSPIPEGLQTPIDPSVQVDPASISGPQSVTQPEPGQEAQKFISDEDTGEEPDLGLEGRIKPKTSKPDLALPDVSSCETKAICKYIVDFCGGWDYKKFADCVAETNELNGKKSGYKACTCECAKKSAEDCYKFGDCWSKCEEE